ncbi:hypothetical protein [Caballeronia sp. GaOx3]|uniref:hypothetical protein n=1 Tax=Caballeronia sp. GaOx3 TaxID=2921740 RepID=UPI0020276F6B|nr:hypothetical protein [Caballeronia sp. GaOx3]
MTSTAHQWERFLDPNGVRPSLFLATMFITTFEILKDSFMDDVRSFYANGFDEHGATVSSDYQSKALSKNKSPLYASLEWLRENDAFDEEDLLVVERLKSIRNRLVHQLFAVVTGHVESRHEIQFDNLVKLLRKIGVWWVVNFEIPTNPAYDGQEIAEEGIVPGSVLMLQMLIQAASGSTELLELWRRRRANA